MKILLTNDDGWDAAGITCLFRELVDCGHKVTLVAPEHEKSATSHSLTIFQPLRLRKRAENVYSVNGFPADCVNLAQKVQPAYDLVISGINGGPNMAEDILYSGTIGGAMEAMFLGYKAIALSILDFSDQYFETAARVMCKLLDRGIVNEIAHKSILNINVPNLPLEKIAGIKLAKPGTRLYHNYLYEQTDPRGNTIFWIGGQKPAWGNEEGTDCQLTNAGFVTISPLRPDFFYREATLQVENWLNTNFSGD